MRHFLRMGFLLGKLLLTTGCVTIMQLDWVLASGVEDTINPMGERSVGNVISSGESHVTTTTKRQSTSCVDYRFGNHSQGRRTTARLDAAYRDSPGPALRYDIPDTREGVPPSPSRSASCRGSRPPETS